MNYKKLTFKLLIPLITLFLFACSAEQPKNTEHNVETNQSANYSDYEKIIKNFEKIKISDIKNNKLENIFIFLGKPSCPYCRDFAPTLYESIKNTDIKIFYVDVSDFEENIELQEFVEKFKLTGVPTLMYLSNNSPTIYDNNDNLKDWLNNIQKK